MVLTAEEQAELDRLQAKAGEPAPAAPPSKIVTVAEDVLNMVRQLVRVHWTQLPGGAAEAFVEAVDNAKDETPADQAPADVVEAPAVDEAPADQAPAFGTETTPGG